MLKILSDMTKVPAWTPPLSLSPKKWMGPKETSSRRSPTSPVMPISPKKWMGSTETSTRHSPPSLTPTREVYRPAMPTSPKKWFHSTDTSTIHSPLRRTHKLPETSPHWPAMVIAIQNDDPEQMLTLLHGIEADLKHETAQVVMNARTHFSVTK